MSTLIQHLKQFALCVLCFAIALALLFPSAIIAGAPNPEDTPTTTSFSITKHIQGFDRIDDAAFLSEFLFHITGDNGISTTTRHLNAIYLPAGSYDVEETGPEGYALWKWSGSGCDETPGTTDSPEASFVIELGDVTGQKNVVCTAENQIAPNGGGTTTPPTNGTIQVSKNVINNDGGTATTSNFSFNVLNGTTTVYEANFETDGSNAVSLPAGTYSVVEDVAGGYTSTSSPSCASINLTSGGQASCSFTNNDIPQGGDGDGDATRYKVEGYVWHDANSNDNWEKDNIETEVVETEEADLDGWTVNIANGSTSLSTITDASGYYSFMVPAGTWTITETVQNEWSQTFPNAGSHVVTVPAVVTEAHVPAILAWFISTAHAQAPAVFGPYNFGNVFVGCTSNCGGGGGGGGGSSSGGGGGGKRNSSSSSSSNADEPRGEVLGAVAPIGAPNTGMGGASGSANGFASTFMLMALLTFSAFISRRQNI